MGERADCNGYQMKNSAERENRGTKLPTEMEKINTLIPITIWINESNGLRMQAHKFDIATL